LNVTELDRESEWRRARILLTVEDLAAGLGFADFFAAAVILVLIDFVIGLETVVDVLDFLGCGASDSSSAFLFLPLDLAAVGALALVLAVVGSGLAVVTLGFAVLGCFFAGGWTVVTLDFFTFGSSSDSSALRLLLFGLVVTG
jgi:hypothetical protein